MSDKKNNGINIENLWFYFDSIERDCMDLGMLDRKSSQVLALKGKLMKLPQLEFDAAIKTIEKLVEDSTPSASKRDVESAKKKASLALYDRVTSNASDSSQSSQSRLS